jgi:hypothetical protein
MDALLSRLEGVVTTPTGYRACCPCPTHGADGVDSHPSLSIDQAEGGKILLHCHVGCATADVLAALDLGTHHLHRDGPAIPHGTPRPNGRAAGGTPRRRRRAAKAAYDPGFAHKVYAQLLAELALSPEHRANLQRRGLPDNSIMASQYRTSDGCGAALAGRLHRWLDTLYSHRGDDEDRDADELYTLPGFHRLPGPENVPLLKLPAGLVLPVRDRCESIRALKVRTDREGVVNKYCYVSSGPEGPSPGTPTHWPIGAFDALQAAVEGGAKEITLGAAEGELKAEVVFRRTGTPTVSVPGVNNWQACGVVDELVAAARKLGLPPAAVKVPVAFDLKDVLANVGIGKQLRALLEALHAEGFTVGINTWPD